MPKKYHIKPAPAAPHFIPVGRSGIIDFEEDCLKCTTCVKKRCLYDVYKNRAYDAQTLVDSIDHQCKNCFSCIQNCPRGVLSKTINPEFLRMGDAYWKPDIIHNTWFQAETGKIPVSGAGYRGPFSGPGFDAMWTDMSEIIRPTRDGIHGREYISTGIDVGRKQHHLEFDASGRVRLEMLPLVEVPLPVIFNVLPFGNLGKGMILSMAEAAQKIGTLMYVTPETYGAFLNPFKAQLIPLLPAEGFDLNAEILEGVKIAELFFAPDVWQRVQQLKERHPQLVVSVRLPINPEARTIAADLARAGVEVIHLFADYQGNEFVEGDAPRFVKDALRDIHTHLVNESFRDQVTLIVSGGIALAEHLPKAIICGADGAAIDLPLLIAMECRVCKRCVAGKSCPVKLQNLDPEYGSRRVVNLMCSWWSQLIELMGAMGIRDVRRVRGEAGRAMFFEDLERDTFGATFGAQPVNRQ
ncbi:MAG: glutamate synthase-related protein [Desulfatirhabdiaceae bacterium]|nr:glutamate synthase-related protein [Desulfatirhabdiaceae bacterium]